jgi:hypothetical protein
MPTKSIQVDHDFTGGAKVTGLPNAVAGTDAVPLSQLRGMLEGNSWKDAVRVASTVNINLAAPGATIDAIAMVTGDRFLAKDQTAQTENGLYVWNGAAVAAVRADDASTFLELEGAVVRVEEGTANAGTKWAQTQVNGTIGTNNVIWMSDTGSAPSASETTAGIAEFATQAETDAGSLDTVTITPLKLKNWSGRKLKTAPTNIGDGTATAFNIDHNFNTRDVIPLCYRNSGSFDDIDVAITRPTVNRVTFTFITAPTTAQYSVTILG